MTTAMWIGIIGFVVLLVLIFLRVWIGLALMMVGFAGLVILKNFGYAGNVIASEPFSQATLYSLTCMLRSIFARPVS